WSNGAVTASISNLNAGGYTLTVEDANGCTSSSTINISQSGTLVAIASVTVNISCNGSSTGAITSVVTGGSTPYTYLWSNGAVTTALSNLPAGGYTLTVTDINGCSSISS